MRAPNALVISLNGDLSAELQQRLQNDFGWNVERAVDRDTVESQLRQSNYSIVFIDLDGEPPSDDVLTFLETYAHDEQNHVAFVAITGPSLPRRWAVLMDHVAVGKLPLPLEAARLSGLVREVIAKGQFNGDGQGAFGPRMTSGGSLRFFTYSPEMYSTLDELELAATHDVTVLLVGETGTGKTYLARLIHELSPRSNDRFLPVACGALPPNLIESELFGHVKGAFTGADRTKMGKFEAAEKGTLLLDEIDVLGSEQQAKLLRVIETNEFEPVGSNETRMSTARLIVASNLDLEAMIAKDRFRADLYYRLNVLQFYIPPLRKRPRDIVPLAMGFIDSFSERYSVAVQRVHQDFLTFLKSYPWPGNVRELENLMRRAVLFCRSGELTPDDLPPSVLRTQTARNRAVTQSAESSPLVEQVAMTEQETIERALRANNYKRAPSARALGVSRVTLYNKMKKYGMLHLNAETAPASEGATVS